MVVLRHCKTVVLCLAALCVLLTSSAFAERLYVAPAGDGQITYWSDHYGSSSTTASNGNTSMGVGWSFGFQYLWETQSASQAEISIASLAGRDLAGYSVTYNFYASQGMVTLMSAKDAEGDGIITGSDFGDYPTYRWWGDIEATQAGWMQVDAKAYLTSQLSKGRSWAIFHFAPAWPQTDGSIGTAESTQGRASYIELTPVPEPSSLLALVVGVSSLGGLAFRRRR